MRIRLGTALGIAAATWAFTTRTVDGAMCFFRFGDVVPGVCAAPVVYYLGFVIAAGLVLWTLAEAIVNWRRGKQPALVAGNDMTVLPPMSPGLAPTAVPMTNSPQPVQSAAAAPVAVAVVGTMRFPVERLTDVLPHLKAHIDATVKNDGCISYAAAEDPFDPGLIRFTEVWPSHEARYRHLQAPHVEAWKAAAHDCGLIERKFTAHDILASRAV